MKNLHSLLTQSSDQPKISGTWFNIRWVPDLASGEKLNLGVGLYNDDGHFGIKLLNNFEKVSCFFNDESAKYQAELACKVALEILNGSKTARGPITSNLMVEDRGLVQGSDIDSLLANLYDETVTLARIPVIPKKSREFVPVSVEKAYSSIRSALKETMGLGFEKCFPPNPYLSVKIAQGERSLYLPFRRKHGAGTLVSAAYADDYRVSTNLFESFMNIDLAVSRKNFQDGAIFLLLPGEGLGKQKQIAIEKKVDEFYTLAKDHKFHFESSVDLSTLSEYVKEWYDKAA